MKGDDFIKPIDINKTTYIIQDNSTQHLLDLGFRKYYDSEGTYIYNFHILEYDNMVALIGRILAYTDDNEIKIDVMDNNYVLYRPFYNLETGNYKPIMDKINKSILKEFKKLGIVKQKETKEQKGNDND